MMRLKACFLLIFALLLTLSLAAGHTPLQAQDSTEPAATEEPCTAIVEAAMQPQDSTTPVVTEDPALELVFRGAGYDEDRRGDPRRELSNSRNVAASRNGRRGNG